MLAMSSYEPDLLAGICAMGKEPESPAVMSEGNPVSSQYTVKRHLSTYVYSLPGAMTLLLMPKGASRVANDLPSIAAPAFVAEYARPAVTKRLKEAILATVMI